MRLSMPPRSALQILAGFVLLPIMLIGIAACGGVAPEADSPAPTAQVPDTASNSDTLAAAVPAVSAEELEIPAQSPAEAMEIWPELAGYELLIDTANSANPTSRSLVPLRGDYFGDGTEDVAFLVERAGVVKMVIINGGIEPAITVFGNEDDPFQIDDYEWVGTFDHIAAGTPLWSNYTDDFRSFDAVPEEEIVRLKHDALFLHALEACGGGFVFWTNNKWNWLQQE